MAGIPQVQKPALIKYFLGIVLVAFLCTSCTSTTTRKTTRVIPLDRETQQIAEAELLDVGVYLFDPGLEAVEADTVIFEDVRNAEARYMAVHLMEAIQSSAAWGAVRVVPLTSNNSDVSVKGKILHSDGERLELQVSVSDISGQQWYTKDYEGLASKYAYGRKSRANADDPFQSVYHQIANDLLQWRRKHFDSAYLRQLRTVSLLKFAADFSPDAFSDHLQEHKGVLTVKRLPADNDPMMRRIMQIRERDYLFVDTLQDYYGAFTKDISAPYHEWRGQSYNEVIALRKLKKQARRDTLLGVVAIIGGIAAAGSDNGSARTAGAVAVAGGGYMIKSGFDKRAQSEMHVEALQELGESLQAEIEPQIIDLEDRTITLSGSVDNQYQQWRELLRDIYRSETGLN